MIKKIEIGINGREAYYFGVLAIAFTVPVEGVWVQQRLIGENMQSLTSTEVVYDNFTATTTIPTDSSWPLSALFDNNTSNRAASNSAGYYTITINLTNPVPAMKDFSIAYWSYLNGYRVNSIKMYDEGGMLLFTHSGDIEATAQATYWNTYATIETPDLETVKIYPTNKVGTVTTKDTCHITDVYSIDLIKPEQTTPIGTSVRYLLSFDGRNTYKSYDTGTSSWVTVDTANIMTQGMTSSELLALTSSEYLLAIDTSYRTLDIMVGLITTDETVSPSIKSIRVSYYKITT